MTEKIKKIDERIISRFWILPEELHNWYLQAISTLKPKDFNPNVQKVYDELTEGQKLIDTFIAEKLNERLKIFEQQIRDNERQECKKEAELEASKKFNASINYFKERERARILKLIDKKIIKILTDKEVIKLCKEKKFFEAGLRQENLIRKDLQNYLQQLKKER